MALNLINSLRIALYTCNYVRKRVDIVRSILDNCDILYLQEILLLEEDRHFINGLDSSFETYVVANKHSSSNCLEGRPSGGLAILCKNLNFEIKIICTHYNFIVASLMTMGKCIAMANIYIPRDDGSRDVLTKYDQVLGELHASFDSADTEY